MTSVGLWPHFALGIYAKYTLPNSLQDATISHYVSQQRMVNSPIKFSSFPKVVFYWIAFDDARTFSYSYTYLSWILLSTQDWWKYVLKWEGQGFIYRISANSFRGNYSFLKLGVRKLFKGGKYSKAKTIRGNMVFISAIYCV